LNAQWKDAFGRLLEIHWRLSSGQKAFSISVPPQDENDLSNNILLYSDIKKVTLYWRWKATRIFPVKSNSKERILSPPLLCYSYSRKIIG
jgi:hypothetical protein